MADTNRKGEENPEKVKQLIKEHEDAGTVDELMNNRGQLNKTRISSVLGFAKSTWVSNPRLSAIADEFNAAHGAHLRDGSEPSTVAESEFARQQALTKARASEKSLKALQDQNALLITENKSLRNELAAMEEMRTARRAFLETTLNHGLFKSARGGG